MSYILVQHIPKGTKMRMNNLIGKESSNKYPVIHHISCVRKYLLEFYPMLNDTTIQCFFRVKSKFNGT